MTPSLRSPSLTPMRRALVDLDALRSNIERYGASSLALDLSRDAFGHGAAEVITCARNVGVERFTVCHEDERLRLREGDPSLPVDLVPVDEEMVANVYGFIPGESRPVMTLKAHVVSVKRIHEGAGVSYGYTFRAPKDGWLALVPLGYGDGFVRALGNRAHGYLGERACPVAGRVAMDVHSLFTGDAPAAMGDPVVYFGEGTCRASEVAALIDAPAASITAALGPRIIREYLP